MLGTQLLINVIHQLIKVITTIVIEVVVCSKLHINITHKLMAQVDSILLIHNKNFMLKSLSIYQAHSLSK